MIISDIDGTLLGHNHRVAPRTAEVVGRAVAAGATFALATGRPYRWIDEVVSQLPVSPLAVTSNGAVLIDTAGWTIMESHLLDPQAMASTVASATEVLAPYGGAAVAVERIFSDGVRSPLNKLFVVDPAYAQRSEDFGFGVAPTDEVVSQPAAKLLIRCDELPAARIYELLAPHIDPTLVHMTYSMDMGIVEFMAPGVTKAQGCAAIARRLGIAQADSIAFGDMPNDIEMLQWAGRGIAMANAAPAVHAAADASTATNTEWGVAAVLEQWF